MASRYVDNEAELSENGEEDSQHAVETDDGPPTKRAKKAKKQSRHQISSDEEEDGPDDEAQIRKEMEGFVVEEGEEEEEEGEADTKGKDAEGSSDSGSEASEGEISEDDLDLVAENTGVNKPVRVHISDDEEVDDRERIKGRLFDEEEDEEEEGPPRSRAERRGKREQTPLDEDEQSGSELSDEFIVNDEAGEGDRGHRRRRKGKSKRNDQCIDDAREVFGVENIDEFYGDEEYEEEGEEGEDGAIVSKKPEKVSLLSMIEPAELAKGFFSPHDQKITMEDIPERFQTRRIPVRPLEEQDLDLEAAWIQEMAFKGTTLTHQPELDRYSKAAMKSGMWAHNEESVAPKITKTLRFIRHDMFEVPFIVFYRKEGIMKEEKDAEGVNAEGEDGFEVQDLWRIYQFDEKWCLLQERKLRLYRLYGKLGHYIRDRGEAVAKLRPVAEWDMSNITGIQTLEELRDSHDHFQLHYGAEMPRVDEWEHQEASTEVTKFKQSGRTDKYLVCVQGGLTEMAELFGLKPGEFAENYMNYGMNEIRQQPEMPAVYAEKFVNEEGVFSTPEEVLKGAIYLHAMQISREPAVRKRMREDYRKRLRFSAHPTRKGVNEIDLQHPLYGKHYIINKPVESFEADEYLQFIKAKNDGLLELRLYVDSEQEEARDKTLLDQVATHYKKDEFSDTAVEWNRLRREVMRVCVNDILIPIFEKEAHEVMLEEARAHVINKAARSLDSRLGVAPFKPRDNHRWLDENDDEEPGFRIMAICYSSDRDLASFAVVLDQNGMVLEHQRLNHFTKRAQSRHMEEANLKKMDLNTLKRMIVSRHPHAIFLGVEDLQAYFMVCELTDMRNELGPDEAPFDIPVDVIDTDVAKAYMKSKMSEEEFPDYPPMLKQAISLGRAIIDPMIEICHLCNRDDDILLMKLHPLQGEVPKSELLWALQMECINRVNEVGVDINRCLEFPHTANTLQFVSGLGPRKAYHILRVLRQNDNFLGSRTKLVTAQCQMGPKVFMNVAGFIRIDTDKAAERTDDYVEVLDGSRVHPETYEWARKMAVDALEYDEQTDQTGAVEEILSNEENRLKLKDLDLDAFAQELERQAFGDKRRTLYAIRAELNHRYKDARKPKAQTTDPELLKLLMPDVDAYETGKIVRGQVLGATYKRVSDKDKGGEPCKGLRSWECPYCKQSGFKTEEIARQHSQSSACPGIITGIRVRLDNGVVGWVSGRDISDQYESYNPLDLLPVGKEQFFRVLDLNFDRMGGGVKCRLSCKRSELRPDEYRKKLRSEYFDEARYQDDLELERKQRQKMYESSNAYADRVITHHSFHNVKYREAEGMLETMHQGEAIFRPSSKDHNSLSVTWKVWGNICQHINIKERGKARVFDLGKELIVGDEKFEDLDEIITRHIRPMADNARNVTSCKYFMDEKSENVELIESHLRSEKERVRSRIPYVITPSEKYPGKFLLSYMLRNIRHEFIAVTPNGLRFRNQVFSGNSAINDLIAWFKTNCFQRPPPPAQIR